MTDRMTPTQRSYTMSRIRSWRNQSTELKLIGQMRLSGIKGWRRNAPVLGRPDLVFSQHRLAVFVDGCFWHGCPRCFAAPKSNIDYWQPKISGNRKRDARVRAELRAAGWIVMGIWEHALRRDPARAAARIGHALARTQGLTAEATRAIEDQ